MSSAAPLADENEKDVQLLMHDPEALLRKYQYLIRHIVLKYVRAGIFDEDHMDDVMQDMNEKLWNTGLERMRQKYDGRTLVKTYLGVIIRSLCSDKRKEVMSQKHRVHSWTTTIEPWHARTSNDGAEQMALRQELRRLGLLLAMFHKQRAKVELMLKCFARVPLAEDDLLAYCPDYPRTQLASLHMRLCANYQDKTDKKLFAQIIDLFNHVEKKENDPDSLRRWLKNKLNDLLTALNGVPPTRSYDEETLGTLLHYYYSHAATQQPETAEAARQR